MEGQIQKIERHILLVAPNARADQLSDQLRSQGYFVRGVQDIQSAHREIQSGWVRLILLDAQLNDAYTLTRQWTRGEQTRHVPIVFVIFRDDAFEKSRVFQSGGVDYLTPPFLAEELTARLDAQLARSLINQAAQVNQQETQARDLVREAELFRRFVPQTLITELYQRDFDIHEGLSQEEIYTVFSCDIRSFTTFAESITSTQCFRFLHSFFAVVEPGIRKFDGFVYQYVGDSIMALFKLQDGRYTDNAVASAVSIQNHIMVEYNQGRARAGYQPIQIGVGINTGTVATGVAGTAERMDACAFGSTVNLAARCEGLTKDFDANIIITDETYHHLQHPEAFDIRSLGKLPIRGMSRQVQLYGVFGAPEGSA